MDAQYVSSMYTTDTEELGVPSGLTDKGAEGVSGYIAYVILLFLFLSYFIFRENSILYYEIIYERMINMLKLVDKFLSSAGCIGYVGIGTTIMYAGAKIIKFGINELKTELKK